MSQIDRLRLCRIVAFILWVKMESHAAFIRHKIQKMSYGLWRSKAMVQVSLKPLKCIARAMEHALRLTHCTRKCVYCLVG